MLFAIKKNGEHGRIEAALSKSFDSLSTSFPDMKDKQVDAVILSGNDVFICLPTGYGKT